LGETEVGTSVLKKEGIQVGMKDPSVNRSPSSRKEKPGSIQSGRVCRRWKKMRMRKEGGRFR